MAKVSSVPECIFKSYDVRGIVGTEIYPSTAELIGAATVRALGAVRLVVGRDMREHSPRLAEALAHGITSAGADVIDIGQCSTPMSYFAAATMDVDGAIMVTASHNPGRYNGFKFCKRGGAPMGNGTGLEKVRSLVLSGDGLQDVCSHPGHVKKVETLDSWCKHLRQYSRPLRPLKIVIDCGNGVMGPIMRELLRRVDQDRNLTITWLFEEPDGSFPWHPADPLTLVNLRHLEGAILATGADFGVAFDGDGDRLALVDEKAHFVGCDLMTAVFAGKLLSEPANHGKCVLYDLRSSVAVKEAIEAAGGMAEMCRVGHSHIKAAMRGVYQGTILSSSIDREIVLGGELSGHFFFQDCFNIDSSERALLLALDIFSEDTRPLSEQVEPLRKYWHSGEINYSLPDEESKNRVLERIEQRFSNMRIFKLDGISVESDGWWFNVRLSNTESVVRLTAESLESRERLEKLLTELDAVISECGGIQRT